MRFASPVRAVAAAREEQASRANGELGDAWGRGADCRRWAGVRLEQVFAALACKDRVRGNTLP